MTQSAKKVSLLLSVLKQMFVLYQVELFYRKGLLPKAVFQIEGTSQEIGSIKGGIKGQILLKMSATQAKLVKNPAYYKSYFESTLKAARCYS